MTICDHDWSDISTYTETTDKEFLCLKCKIRKVEPRNPAKLLSPSWSTEQPTTPGFYWIRMAKRMRFPSMDIREGEVFVVEVKDDEVYFPGDDRDERVSDIAGEWAGPIEPPAGDRR